MTKRKRRPETQIVQHVNEYFENSGYFTARELDLGYGRADLVSFKVNYSRVQNRLKNKQLRLLSRVEYYSIMRLLPEAESGAAFTIQDIASSIPLSERYIRTELLSNLIRYGYVEEIESGNYAKVNGFVPFVDEIIAVEAKVSDWKKGAIQAKRYQVFANKTYLAVSSSYAHRVDYELLRNHQIGMLSVEDHAIHELISAPNLIPKDEDRFNFAAEWLWRYRRSDLKKGANNASEQCIP
jgi:hypothetical protein